MVRMAGEARVKKVRKVRSCMFEFKFMVNCSWKAENWWRWRHGLQQTCPWRMRWCGRFDYKVKKTKIKNNKNKIKLE
jgi:hypothetical protein